MPDNVAELTRRVSIIETEMAHLSQEDRRMAEELAAFRSDVKELTEALQKNNQLMTRWKGIGAGVVIAISVIWTGVISLVAMFTNFWNGSA